MPARIYHSHEYVSSLIYKYLLAARAGKKHRRKLAFRATGTKKYFPQKFKVIQTKTAILPALVRRLLIIFLFTKWNPII